MNTTQIKCFLTLAETLNFTKAAARLYISQPALSRQIVTLEREINTLLFIRDQKSVRLTPSGTILASELGNIQASWDDLVMRAQTVALGHNGALSIGVLDGHWMGDDFTDLCRRFTLAYPNIEFNLMQGSFSTLRHKLDSGEIDIAITIEFDIAEYDALVYRRLIDAQAMFAVSRRLPLGQMKNITFQDILTEPMLVISPEDCRIGGNKLLNQMRKMNLPPKRFRYAPDLGTLLLWIEAGLGVGLITQQSNLARNPSVRLISELPLGDASTCAAWRKDNLNPAIALFDQMIDRHWGH